MIPMDEREEAADKGITVWNFDSMQDSECAPANWLSCKENGVPGLYQPVLGHHRDGRYMWVGRAPDIGAANQGNLPYKWMITGSMIAFPGHDITHWCYVSPCKEKK